MKYVWLFLILASVGIGAFTGNIENVTQSAIEMAGTAVNIAIGLIGIMSLWLGIMKIAEDAKLIRLLARLIRPVSRRLFPDIPQDHPAIGSMMLNISANWLGLGNAATPFGIKAMEQLQELNPDKDTATRSMIMFLALNTASITFIPMTIIGVRTSLGSEHPTAVIGTTIFSSVVATLVAIIAVTVYSQLAAGPAAFLQKLRRYWLRILMLFTVIVVFKILLSTGVAGRLTAVLPPGLFEAVIRKISIWAIPALLFLIPLFAFIKKVNIYQVFIEGAKEGFQVAVRIIPFLVAILAVIAMFRASGGMELLVAAFSPLTQAIGLPAEVLPAAVMRPLSGSGTLGLISELLKTHGPDSFIGYLSSTIYGCTETTFYVIAVYFGAVGIKRTRYAIPAGLTADIAGVLAAVYICRLLFL
ncbi:MAG: nucleoside recognition domain-containing protein [candidate division KSB1 bacterium]|nr:nucleoside recognition domain-containing protein [candidate division KSB1 bacterium]